jgi:hypothetical protein
MKFGKDEISQGVRLNDAVAEAYDGMDGVAMSLDVDIGDLVYVMGQRTEMLVEGALTEIPLSFDDTPPGMVIQALLMSSWADGFFAALHMVEQAQDAEKEQA